MLDLDRAIPPGSRWVADYLSGVAAEVQVAPDLVLPLALSLASLAVCGACVFVGQPGHVEASPIWTATTGPPSSRKSAIVAKLERPFHPLPVDTWRPRHPAAPVDGSEELGEQEPGEGGSSLREILSPLLESIESVVAEFCAPSPASLLCSDGTPAGMASKLLDTGQLGVISDEGFPLQQFVRAAANGDIDLLLKAWSGQSVSILRRSGDIMLTDPEIVVGLLVQPSAMVHLRNPHAISRGLSQRFLFSEAGAAPLRRYGTSAPVPIHLAAAWDAQLRALRALPRTARACRREVQLTAEALALYAETADRYTELQADERLPEALQGWFGKAHGQVLRIAGVFELLGASSATTIGPAAIQSATYLVDYFSHHARTLFGTASADGSTTHAGRVVAWLRTRGARCVSRNEITQALRCRDLPHARDWDAVFARLVELAYLRPAPAAPRASLGGRPSPQFEVNPALIPPGGHPAENPGNPASNGTASTPGVHRAGGGAA